MIRKCLEVFKAGKEKSHTVQGMAFDKLAGGQQQTTNLEKEGKRFVRALQREGLH